jgi:hypothetical protein
MSRIRGGDPDRRRRAVKHILETKRLQIVRYVAGSVGVGDVAGENLLPLAQPG